MKRRTFVKTIPATAIMAGSAIGYSQDEVQIQRICSRSFCLHQRKSGGKSFLEAVAG